MGNLCLITCDLSPLCRSQQTKRRPLSKHNFS